MTNKRLDITTMIGRFVYGSLYKPYTTDSNGQLLTYKNGPEAGKPRVEYRVGLAIKKGAEQHWAQTQWGALIYQFAKEAFPAGQFQQPTFAWKITDGDSDIPNKKGRKPCEREGYPGHWILNFSNSIAPTVCTISGQKILEEDAVLAGNYVQIFGNIAKNSNAMNPGLYLNLVYVAHAGDGNRIQVGPDPTQVGFGGQLPPEARPASAPGQRLPEVAPLGMPTGFTPPMLTTGTPAMPMPVSNIQPYPAILNTPAAMPMPPLAPPSSVQPVLTPPPAPQRIMTPKAGNYTYEQYLAAGWNDARLIQEGHMILQ